MGFNLGNALGGALAGGGAGSFLGPVGAIGGALIGGLSGGFSRSKPKNPKIRQQSLLRKEQEPLYQQAVAAGLTPGVGGAFGDSADYYRSLLADEGPDYEAFKAPAMREYYQDIVPNISEQFAGMGSGGLSSSGFMNAQNQGAVDLSERLGQLRAQLRNQGAQGLANIGRLGLNPYSENVMNQPQPGFWDSVSQGIGSSLPQVATLGIKNYMSGGGSSGYNSNIGYNTSPYQSNNIPASPSGYRGKFGQLPNYGGR